MRKFLLTVLTATALTFSGCTTSGKDSDTIADSQLVLGIQPAVVLPPCCQHDLLDVTRQIAHGIIELYADPRLGAVLG